VICVRVVKSPRTRNRRGEGARLREEIVAAAARLIEEGGQDAVSLRAIARRAGITAPSIYAHFEDLDEVLEAVVANTFEALTDYLRRGVEGHPDPVARLRGTCHAYLAFGHEHPEQYAVLFSRTFALPTEVDKTVDNMVGAEAFSFLIDGIRECVAAGHSDSTQLQEDATALWVALHGYVGLRTAIPDFPWPPEEVVLDNLIDRIARLT
jgi:AcrR family transcriptional regulator